MQFLFSLAESGNVRDATLMPVTRWARKLFGQGADSKPKSIKEVGKLVAQRIMESERDAGRTAAILLLTALDAAYNSVLAVSYPQILHGNIILTNECPSFQRYWIISLLVLTILLKTRIRKPAANG